MDAERRHTTLDPRTSTRPNQFPPGTLYPHAPTVESVTMDADTETGEFNEFGEALCRHGHVITDGACYDCGADEAGEKLGNIRRPTYLRHIADHLAEIGAGHAVETVRLAAAYLERAEEKLDRERAARQQAEGELKDALEAWKASRDELERSEAARQQAEQQRDEATVWLDRIERGAGFGLLSQVAEHQARSGIDNPAPGLRERRVQTVVDEMVRYRALVDDADGVLDGDEEG